MTGDLNMDDHKIINLIDPENYNDAVNKTYFENNLPNEYLLYMGQINLYKNEKILPLQIVNETQYFTSKKDGVSTDPRPHAFVNLELILNLRRSELYYLLLVDYFSIILLYKINSDDDDKTDIIDISVNNPYFTLLNSGLFPGYIALSIKNNTSPRYIGRVRKISFKIRYFGSNYNDDIDFQIRPGITTNKCDKFNPLFYSYMFLVNKFNLNNNNHYLENDLFLIKFPKHSINNIEDTAAKIQNLATPTNSHEAANKKYVDELIDETVQQI